MKNKYLKMAALSTMMFSAVVLTSCNDETLQDESLQTNETVKANAISFTFSTPQGSAVTYAPNHDQAEWSVKKLTILEFDADRNYVTRVEIADIATSAAVTAHGDGRYTYTKEFTPGSTGLGSQRIFAFVANADVPTVTNLQDYLNLDLQLSAIEGGSSKDLLKEIDGTRYFPMSGFATSSGNVYISNQPGNAEVKLKRAVARVDVKSNQTWLKITDVKILKANEKAKIADNPTDLHSEIPTINLSHFVVTSPLTNTDKSFAGYNVQASGVQELTKAAYLYEDYGTVNSGQEVIVQVKGLLNGIPVVYNIPFKNASGEVIKVKRNYAYQIVLGDENPTPPPAPDADIRFKIVVKDWEDGGEQVVQITPISIQQSGTPQGAAQFATTANTNTSTLTVDNTSATNTFTLGNMWSTGTVTYSVEGTMPSWMTAQISGNTLTVTTQAYASGTAPRTAGFKVKATNNGSTTPVEHTFNVKQNN